MIRAVLITIIFIFVFTSSSFAQFTDVPVGHWSNKALYFLVKKGITSGYPDGTFRGDKLMTRYEIAIFLSKLASILENEKTMMSVSDEKLIEEFRSELAYLRSSLKETKEAPKPEFGGNFMFRFRNGNAQGVAEDRSTKMDYRLRANLRKDFKNGIIAGVELDTLDAGFGGLDNNGLVTNMLNAEGSVKFDTSPLPIRLKATIGPGKVIHRENDPAMPGDDVMAFEKPDPGIEVSTSTYGMDLSLSYVATDPSISGEVSVHDVSATTGFTVFHVPLVNKMRFHFTPRYLFTQKKDLGAESDVRADIKMEFVPSSKFKTRLTYGFGSTSESDSSYINLGFTLNDIFDTGTYLLIELHKVGQNYRIANFNKLDFVELNLFDKLILDGTSDIGIKLTQNISDRLDFVFTADQVLTSDFEYGDAHQGTSLTLEGGLSYIAAQNTVIDLFLRTYDVPSGVAYASDPLLMTNVAKHSSLIGAKLKYSF